MKFNKYPKLTNTYDTSFIYKAMEEVPKDVKWYVTEKIHGANFQITGGLDDRGEFKFKVGSRNAFTNLSFFSLESSEPFMQEYVKALEVIKDCLRGEGVEGDVTIYGEVYGGNVQKGIYYSSFKRFRAFDIMVNGSFLNRNNAIQKYDKYELDYCTTIMQGRLEDCLNHANDFNSLINSELTMGEVLNGNICEGVVIRPVKPCYTVKGEFIAIKNKNDKWAEKSRLPKHNKQSPTLQPEMLELYTKMDEYVTSNTVNSAISKIGRDLKYIPELMKELNSDIIESVMAENKEFNLKDCKLVFKRFNNRLIKMIKKEIQSN